MSDGIGFAMTRKTSRASLFGSWLSSGTVNIYTGTRPVSADTAITDQVLLISIVLPDVAGTAANGVFTAATIEPAMAIATGEASWARLTDEADQTIADVDVGLMESGAAMTLDSLALFAGGYVSIASFTLTEG